MTARPILFCAEMVRATLDDRKSQTRRVVKPRDPWHQRGDGEPDWTPALLETGEWGWIADGCTVGIIGRCPYGEPGDHLWVREAWALPPFYDPRDNVSGDRATVRYRADQQPLPADWGSGASWRPSIFMPRWASRLTLIVTDVRVERLQDITEADARAEGVGTGDDGIGVLTNGAVVPVRTYRGGFRFVWNTLNAKRGHGWDLNEWVWVVGFKMLRGAT